MQLKLHLGEVNGSVEILVDERGVCFTNDAIESVQLIPVIEPNARSDFHAAILKLITSDIS